MNLVAKILINRRQSLSKNFLKTSQPTHVISKSSILIKSSLFSVRWFLYWAFQRYVVGSPRFRGVSRYRLTLWWTYAETVAFECSTFLLPYSMQTRMDIGVGSSYSLVWIGVTERCTLVCRLYRQRNASIKLPRSWETHTHLQHLNGLSSFFIMLVATETITFVFTAFLNIIRVLCRCDVLLIVTSLESVVDSEDLWCHYCRFDYINIIADVFGCSLREFRVFPDLTYHANIIS